MFTPEQDQAHLQLALAQAQKSLGEGGIPIGDCLERLGRPNPSKGGLFSALGIKVLRECTMYTTLSPCIMCSATCLLYQLPRIVLGENETYLGGEELLRSKGVAVVNLESKACREMMKSWVEGKGKEIWWEDIGLDTSEGGSV